MKDKIITLGIVAILSIFLIIFFEKFIDFNPFKSAIKVSETFVNKLVGEEMELNKNTNKNNPLRIMPKSNKNKNKNSKEKHNKNLVFTSAGDKTKFDSLWLGNNQEYDVMVVYYGNNESTYNKYAQKVDYILKRKGSKFQNFHYIYENHKDILNKYDRFFILDDDIIFSVEDINKMFALSKKYNFDICGPTFKKTKNCKISHDITETQNKNQYRYTNFVEVNVPLFNRKALDRLMYYYDPVLIGWGIDYLYIWANGKDKRDSYALIDSVTCINPDDSVKGGNRELLNITNSNERIETYQKFARKIGMKPYPTQKVWNTHLI